MVNKSNLSEEDVKERYITPAIREKGWKPTDYRMEYEYTDGRITVLKNGTKRGKRKKIDYLLNYRENVPIAIIEAKDLNHTYDHGMQQGIGYAEGLKEGDRVESGDVIGYMGHTGYSTKENVNNIDSVHLHFGIQLIFDESQKDGNGEIWIDCYNLTRFLSRHRSEVVRDDATKEWRRN